MRYLGIGLILRFRMRDYEGTGLANFEQMESGKWL